MDNNYKRGNLEYKEFINLRPTHAFVSKAAWDEIPATAAGFGRPKRVENARTNVGPLLQEDPFGAVRRCAFHLLSAVS